MPSLERSPDGLPALTVRPATPADRAVWDRLYAAYATFYEVDQPAAARDRVWGWVIDPAHEVGALLVVDEAGAPVGLAHYRTFARPLAASVGLYLDDLYIDPAARGRQGGAAVLAALRAMARANGWSVVRWITDEHNHRARALYDRSATRTAWLTYDMAPDEPS